MNRLSLRPSPSILLVLVLVLAVAGCGLGGAERRSRPAGSATWVDPRVATLGADAARALRAGGADEVFLSVATLRTEGGRLLVEPWPGDMAGALPKRTPTTLAIEGLWPPEGATPSTGQAAEALLAAVGELRVRADRAELLPVGVHLHLQPGASSAGEGGEALEALGAIALELRNDLPDDLFLSLSVDRSWLAVPEVETLVRTADFVVPFLYGDAPGAPDRPEVWDPEQVAQDAARLDQLDTDYLVGVRTVGSASHRGPAGEVLEVTTRASLAALAENQGLRRSIGDAFGGVGRLVYVFQAQRRTQAAGWQLSPGDSIRVVGTAPALLHALRNRLEDGASAHRLGLLFHRAPGPGEDLTPAAAALASTLGLEPPVPDLRGELVVESSGQETVVLGIALENLSTLSTDLALGEGNYVSLEARDAFVESVEPGDFARYSLWLGGREVRPGLGWREPDEVRLYTPMVAGAERIGGARVTLAVRRGDASALLGGRFYLPDGQELELEATGGPLSGIADPGPESE